MVFQTEKALEEVGAGVSDSEKATVQADLDALKALLEAHPEADKMTDAELDEMKAAKEKLMNRINEVSFAVNDVLLYLDTHPCCEEAISFYQECEQERQKLLKEYAQCYGPLTVDDALESGGDTWKWAEQPFPWEQEGGCR